MTTDLVRAPEQLFEGVEEEEVVKKEEEEPSIKVVRDARVGQRALQPPQIQPPINDPVVAALPEMVKGSLERVDVDVRKDLLLNIVLSGGGLVPAGQALRRSILMLRCHCARPSRRRSSRRRPLRGNLGSGSAEVSLSSLGSFHDGLSKARVRRRRADAAGRGALGTNESTLV